MTLLHLASVAECGNAHLLRTFHPANLLPLWCQMIAHSLDSALCLPCSITNPYMSVEGSDKACALFVHVMLFE